MGVASWLSEVPAEPTVATAEVRDLVVELDAAARRAAATAREGPAAPGTAPLRLPKSRLAALGRCERSAVAAADSAGADSDAVSEALLRGLAADRFVIHQLHAGPVLDPVRDLGEMLRAEGGWPALHALEVWSERDPDAAAAALGAVAAAVEDAWTGIDRGWLPRTQSAVTVTFGDGDVVCSGVLDVVLGGPPTDLPTVLIEVKAGSQTEEHVAEIGYYSLLVAARDGVPPAAAGRWYPGYAPASAPVSAGTLESAARRLADGISRWAELSSGRRPEERPGPWCAWCPDADRCPSSASGSPAADPSIDVATIIDPDPNAVPGSDAASRP